MDYKPNRAETAKFLKSSQIRGPLTLAAARWLARARVLVPKDSGATAASGRLVHKTNGGVKRDRAVVTVVFGGKAVQLQFGNEITKATRFLTRAGE